MRLCQLSTCIVRHTEVKTDLPPTLPEIARTTSIKMLGVTVTNHLSVSEHVRDVISRCAQSMHWSFFEVMGWVKNHLQVGCSCKVAVCSACLVGLHHGGWQETTGSVRSTGCPAKPVPSTRTDNHTAGRSTWGLTVSGNTGWWKSCHPSSPPAVFVEHLQLRPRRHQRQLTIKPDNKNFLIRKLYEDIY